jgi:hypothetical protein
MGACCVKSQDGEPNLDNKMKVDSTLIPNSIMLICDESELNGSKRSQLPSQRSDKLPSELTSGSYRLSALKPS